MIDPMNAFMLIVLPLASIFLVMLAVAMFAANLPLFRNWRVDHFDAAEDAKSDVDVSSSISVLIPARNEAKGIRAAIEAVLANDRFDAGGKKIDLEVVVMDDGSTDGTGDLVRSIANVDARVRLIEGIDLPEGWNGKQHACYRLAEAARYDGLLFLDADVRLQHDALEQLSLRKANGINGLPIGLLSAFPRQETGTLLEKMLIPMMHFILLCYLPFSRMRGSTHPAYASGCGQLFFTDKSSYKQAGTHAAIRASRHDGLKLPKAFRKNEMLTDCVDGTELATCRMYTNASEVIRGLLKNANEGIANKRLLIPFTILLGGAHLLPWVTLAYAIGQSNASTVPTGELVTASISPTLLAMVIVVNAIIIASGFVPRILGAVYLRQSWLGVLLHPIAVLVFLICQWWAFVNDLRGRKIAWRGRQ